MTPPWNVRRAKSKRISYRGETSPGLFRTRMGAFCQNVKRGCRPHPDSFGFIQICGGTKCAVAMQRVMCTQRATLIPDVFTCELVHSPLHNSATHFQSFPSFNCALHSPLLSSFPRFELQKKIHFHSSFFFLFQVRILWHSSIQTTCVSNF